MQRDYSMKMKHCDMPMPIQNIVLSTISPQSLPERKIPDTNATVADHLKRFLTTQESSEQAKFIMHTVREYGSLDSNRNLKQSAKPQSTSNQSAKQVRFDIKMGVLDLIKETGIDLTKINYKDQNIIQPKAGALTARPRSHSNSNVLPPLSEKNAIKLALNYKKQVINRIRNQQTGEDLEQLPMAEKIAPMPSMPQIQPKLQTEIQKPGTIKRVNRQDFHSESIISRELTTISNQDSDSQHVEPFLNSRRQAGRIVRNQRSYSRNSEPHPIKCNQINVQRIQLTPQKAPSPPQLSPQKPRQAHKNISLSYLFQTSYFWLLESINQLKSIQIPAAKKNLHQLIETSLQNNNYQANRSSEMLKSLRENLATVILGECLSDLETMAELKQRIRKHKYTLVQVSKTEQLKVQILQDIISRLQQKLILLIFKINFSYRKELKDQFESYYYLLVQQPLYKKTFQQIVQSTAHSLQYNKSIAIKILALQTSKLCRIFTVWSQSRVLWEAKRQRNIEVVESCIQKVQMKIIKGLRKFAIKSKLKKNGLEIASRMHIYRLRWRVFLRWVASHRLGNKIKRRALARLNRHAASDMQSSQASQGHQQSTDTQQLTSNIQITSKQLFLGQVQDTLQIRRSLNKEMKFDQPNASQINNLVAPIPQSLQQIYSNTAIAEQYSDSDITIALQPQILRLVSNMPSKYYQQKDYEVDLKYSVHAALVNQQNMFGIDQESSLHVTNRDDVQTNKNRVSSSYFPKRLFEVKPIRTPNQLFQKMQQKAIQYEVDLSLKEKIQSQIQTLVSQLKALKQFNNEGYHRAQAIYMQFKTNTSKEKNWMSLSEYLQISLQSGASLVLLNSFKLLSKKILMWKKMYYQRILQNDLKKLRVINIFSQTLATIKHVNSNDQKKAKRLYETRKMQNFFTLFLSWASSSRQSAYENKKLVQRFIQRRILKHWRVYNGVTEVYKNKEQAANRFLQNCLQTKVLVSLYSNRLFCQKVKKFQRRQFFLKFFKRRWMDKGKKRIQLRQIFQKAVDRSNHLEKSYYQRQFDLVKDRFDRWRSRTHEKEIMIKNYMALNHFRVTLLFKALDSFKRIPNKNKAEDQFKTAVLGQVQDVLSLIKNTEDKHQTACIKFRQYCGEQTMIRIFKEWRQHVVKKKIAQMFFKRKYLRALQDYIFDICYQRPYYHYNQRLKVISFFTLRDFKLQKWQRDRQDLLRSANIGKYDKKLMRKVFNAVIDYVLQSKRKRIVRQTVIEFRQHAQLERSVRIWRLYCMLRKKQRLMIQVANEFREEQLRKEVYRGNIKFVVDKKTGQVVSQNLDLQQRAFNALKSVLKLQLEARLQQILRAKGQIRLVRCFLSWRSLAKFQHSETSSIQQPTLQVKDQFVYQPHDDPTSMIFIGNHKLSMQSLIQTSENSQDKVGPLPSAYLQSSCEDLYQGQQRELAKQFELMNVSLTESSLGANEPFTYTAAMFCNTSRSNENEFLTSGGQAQSTTSHQSNLFQELEQLHLQQQKWEQEQSAREKLYQEMAKQYQTLKIETQIV